MKKYQIITAIVGAAAIGAITKSAELFPNVADILVAANLFVSAVVSYVVSKKTA